MLAQSSSSSSTPPLSLPEHIQQLKQNFKDWQTKSSDYRLKHSEHSPLFQIINDTGLCDFLPTHENNLLNQILDDEINLELASDHGISQPLLLALILLEEGRSRFNPELIAQITQEGLNQVIQSGAHAGYSPLFCLTANPEGLSLLDKHPELITQITEEGLNQVIQSGAYAGQSPLYLLTTTPEGPAILDKHPELIAQITQEGLNQVIQSGAHAGYSPLYGLTATCKGRAILSEHPELIAQITQEGLNQVIQSGKDAGYFPLFCLTANPGGLSLLDKHPELIAQITQESLNQVIQSGAHAGHSLLYLLTSTAEGQAFLDKHPELIAQITKESLNQVIQSGAHAGHSPLFWLTGKPEGLSLLGKHPELIAQITQEGLNQIVTSGKLAGLSPLYWLTRNSPGLSLLDKHPELIAQITKESLNQVIPSGEFAGYFPLCELTGSPEGRTLLSQHPGLIDKITAPGLNQAIASGEYAGHSPLSVLSGTGEGQTLLSQYPGLIDKITAQGLNQAITSGEYAGSSPLFWLTGSPEGLTFLSQHPGLIDKITAQGLNQAITSGELAGQSPLYGLAGSPEGLTFLSQHPKLIAQITAQGLNQVMTSGEDAGSSPLFWLTNSPEGLTFLSQHPELIAQITVQGLNQAITRGEHAGSSPLFWLTGTRGGQILLSQHPELIAQITAQGLNQVITSGKDAGSSPLFWLTNSPEGLTLLSQHPELIAQITAQGLNQIATSGELAGCSPLYGLTAKPEGRTLLGQHPKLIAQITAQGLNQIATSGEDAGCSPLLWLTRHSEGLTLLSNHPKLIAKITQQGLNQVMTSGEDAGSSPLFWLAGNPEGRTLLSQHPGLIDKITAQGLNRAISSGELAGYSPLFGLTGTYEGQILLGKHPELIAQITAQGLNQAITRGEYAGCSPLYGLTGNPEGLTLLDKYPELIAQITAQGLNQVIPSGKHAGSSLLYELTSDNESRVFLARFLPRIGIKISEAGKPKVFEAFQQNQGEQYSGYGLAYCYEKGIGCAVDKEQALELYLQSADKGVLEAKLACARLYEEKEQFDKARAIYQAFIQDKAFNDFPLALQAQILSQSLKLDLDPHIEVRLYQLFKAAVAVPVSKAWLGLGQCYLFGIGTRCSSNQAKICFEEARKYEEVSSEAEGYLTVLNQGSDFKKHYCDELAQQLSVLGIERVSTSDDGLYRFRLSVEFIRKLGATEGLFCQVSLSKASLLKLSGILLPSENLLSYPSIIAAFKGAYHAEQRRLKIEAVMTVKNRRLEIAERFGKIYNELRKLLNNHAPQVYRAWNEANQINRDLSSGAGKESVSRKSAGFFTSFTSFKDKLLQNERALEQSRDQYLDDYLAFHQRYIKGNELGKAVAAYQADDFENGDLLLDKAKGQALLAEMERVLGNIQTLVNELKVSLDGFQTKHKDFEKFAGHYRYQHPVDTSGNLSEAVSVPSYLEYIQAAELEYARFEAIQKALPPAIEEKKEEVDSEEEIFESFNTLSLVNQSEPILLSDEQLRPLVQGQPVMTAASSAVSSSGLYYFSHQNYGPKAFEKRLDFSELSHCLKTFKEANDNEAKVLIYALLYELGDVMERLKNLNAHEFCRSHASQLRNVLYHATKLEPIKQPHLYLHEYRELSQKLVAYLARVPVSFTKVFDAEKLMTEIPCGLFNILLNYPSEEPLKSEEIIELITGLNGQESLIQNSQLTEEYQAKACKFIIGRKGALLADLEYQFPNAYQLYFAGNVSVKTDRELGKEFRHGLEY